MCNSFFFLCVCVCVCVFWRVFCSYSLDQSNNTQYDTCFSNFNHDNLIKNLCLQMPLGWWAHDTLLVLLLWALLCGRKLVLLITWRRVNPHITQRTHDLTVLKENGEDTVVIPEERPQKTTKCPKKCGYVIVLTASYTFIGVWLGWASNFNLGYVPSDLEIAMSGLALFILAEVVLVGSSVYIMIKHCRLMSTLWVSVLETLSTTGFMLLTFTLPSCVLLLVRIIICSYQAYRHKICS